MRCESGGLAVEQNARLDVSAVERFLGRSDLIEELDRVRREGSFEVLGEELREYLEGIFFVFEPVALRLIGAKVRKFVAMDAEMEEEVLAEQRCRLWKLMLTDFRWDSYDDPDRAVGALVNYLVKASGSFFSKDVVATQVRCLIGGDEIRRGDIMGWRTRIRFERPVENLIIRKESKGVFLNAWKRWKSEASEKQVMAVEARYIDGVSMEELAEESGVGVGAVKNLIGRGKRSLYRVMKEEGVEVSNLGRSGDLLLEHGSKMELLEDRRRRLLELYPEKARVLEKTPKVRMAVETFYGLIGEEPVYDYKMTAEMTGMSYMSVRIYVPRGVRLLLGVDWPMMRTVDYLEGKGFYQYWLSRRRMISLTEVQEKILEGYFGEGLSQRLIGERMGFGESWVRRRIIEALGMIRVCQMFNSG